MIVSSGRTFRRHAASSSRFIAATSANPRSNASSALRSLRCRSDQIQVFSAGLATVGTLGRRRPSASRLASHSRRIVSMSRIVFFGRVSAGAPLADPGEVLRAQRVVPLLAEVGVLLRRPPALLQAHSGLEQLALPRASTCTSAGANARKCSSAAAVSSRDHVRYSTRWPSRQARFACTATCTREQSRPCGTSRPPHLLTSCSQWMLYRLVEPDLIPWHDGRHRCDDAERACGV